MPLSLSLTPKQSREKINPPVALHFSPPFSSPQFHLSPPRRSLGSSRRSRKIYLKEDMNRFGSYEQNAMAGFEGMKMVDSVVCPKPRRLCALNPLLYDSGRPPYRPFNHYQSEIEDSQAASELLDLILNKGDSGGDRSLKQLASSPPFFSGSPPSRASNPVIQDEQFGSSTKMGGPFSPTTAGRNGSCVRMKSGDKPVVVRIEGFNCRRNCSIPSVA